MERIWNKQGAINFKIKQIWKKNKKCTAKSIKHPKDQLKTGVNKIIKLIYLEKAVYLCSEIHPDIITVLIIIAIYPASVAVVKWGISFMNLIMKNL